MVHSFEGFSRESCQDRIQGWSRVNPIQVRTFTFRVRFFGHCANVTRALFRDLWQNREHCRVKSHTFRGCEGKKLPLASCCCFFFQLSGNVTAAIVSNTKNSLPYLDSNFQKGRGLHEKDTIRQTCSTRVLTRYSSTFFCTRTRTDGFGLDLIPRGFENHVPAVLLALHSYSWLCISTQTLELVLMSKKLQPMMLIFMILTDPLPDSFVW